MRKPTIEDVRRTLGGDSTVVQTVRRSGHDHFDAVIADDEVLRLVLAVRDQVIADEARQSYLSHFEEPMLK